MVSIVHGDVLKANAQIIAHQVNCQGVMGSGVAACVRKKLPVVFELYRNLCRSRSGATASLLGKNQYLDCALDGRVVTLVNMFAQDRYGDPTVTRYTDYDAFRECCRRLKTNALTQYGKSVSIAMPYLIGCGRGGGDWAVILSIVEQELGDLNVTFYRVD